MAFTLMPRLSSRSVQKLRRRHAALFDRSASVTDLEQETLSNEKASTALQSEVSNPMRWAWPHLSALIEAGGHVTVGDVEPFEGVAIAPVKVTIEPNGWN
jgi:hypothetical protein